MNPPLPKQCGTPVCSALTVVYQGNPGLFVIFKRVHLVKREIFLKTYLYTYLGQNAFFIFPREKKITHIPTLQV